jgi:predicted outer membrane repeat protein
MITTPLLKSCTLYVILSLFTLSSYGQLYVDVSAGAGGDGSSWAAAFNDLQTALGSASAGDEIWVASGTYTITGDRNTSFEIPSGVEIYGGFNGTEASRAQRNWELNTTSLNGNNYNHTVVYFYNSSSSTVLDGFVIEDGLAEEGGLGDKGKSGGGIYIDGITSTPSSPKIKNCIIQNNYSSYRGGGVLINASFDGVTIPQFTNCTFQYNSTGTNGGAIYADGTFGGVCNPTYEDCIFYNNQANNSGGALFCQGQNGDVSSTFNRCNFDNNSTINEHGGAMYSIGNSGGKADHIITNCRFYKNAAVAAGAIYSNAGTGSASPIITNCTFYGNTTDPGAGGTGGAIYSNGDGGGTSSTIITNCIIWGNLGLYDTQVLKNVSCSPTISYSIVDAASCADMDKASGSNLTCGPGMQYNIDPLFNNMTAGDLHLSSSSPAIDNGQSSLGYGPEDLDHNPREVGTVDLGAYESATTLPVELAYFQVQRKGRKAELTWATFNEDHNDFFVVERSDNGLQFYPIARIEGAGSSSNLQAYESMDTHPAPGNNYYRIKDVAYDGATNYSPIKIVNFGSESISIYPNPVKESIQVSFSDEMNLDHAKYEVHSVYGQLLFTGLLSADGTNAIIDNIALANLVPGQFVLSIHLSNNESIHKRFIKI